jgi:hypothetical protein
MISAGPVNVLKAKSKMSTLKGSSIVGGFECTS